jgi:hypothetical protein
VTNESVTADDLKRLPLLAIVALCARCAARLRPEFDLPASTPDRGSVMAAVDRAVRMAFDFAAGRPLPDDAEEVVSAGMRADGAGSADMFGSPKAGMAAGVALTIHEGQTNLVPYRAHMCVRAAGDAATAARADYERLLCLGLGEFPNLGQPVDASEKGPLGGLWASRG